MSAAPNIARIVAIASFIAMTGCAVVPEPLEPVQLADLSKERLAEVVDGQEPVSRPIGLYEAMARALKYNLDHRVELFERSVRSRELAFAHYDMLPGLVADSGYSGRDSYSASTSRQVIDGDLGPPGAFSTFNTSQEKIQRSADIELSWNVLDFGLSYVRARQSADKLMIAEESRRKVINRVVEDVRTAFWRAVTADRLLARAQQLEGRTKKALRDTRTLAREQQSSPITALTYERELIDIKRNIQGLQRDLSVAKIQLAALMNLKPGTTFTLSYPRSFTKAPPPPPPADAMIWTAMNNRPELRDITYQGRINVAEADAALLELLPGLKLYAGSNYDSNDFMLNADWLSWGAKASWNLMQIVRYPERQALIENRQESLHQRGLALTMAVMTQVHVSRARYFDYRRELETANEYLEIQRRLVEKLRAEFSAGRISDQTLIREEMNLLVADVKRDVAYAGVQNAYANIYASMGLDPYQSELDFELDVDALSERLSSVWMERSHPASPSVSLPAAWTVTTSPPQAWHVTVARR